MNPQFGKKQILTYTKTPEEQEWFARCYERLATGFKPSVDDKKAVNLLLQKSEAFDHYLHMKFRSVKRYGLEGCETLLPCMDTLFRKAAAHSVQEAVISMPHRGFAHLFRVDPMAHRLFPSLLVSFVQEVELFNKHARISQRQCFQQGYGIL